MEAILAHAQQLVYTLLSLMPSQYQRDNLQAILGLFLEAQGQGTPSPALLGLKLVKALPQVLTKRYQVMILVDTAFGTADFLPKNWV